MDAMLSKALKLLVGSMSEREVKDRVGEDLARIIMNWFWSVVGM